MEGFHGSKPAFGRNAPGRQVGALEKPPGMFDAHPLDELTRRDADVGAKDSSQMPWGDCEMSCQRGHGQIVCEMGSNPSTKFGDIRAVACR